MLDACRHPIGRCLLGGPDPRQFYPAQLEASDAQSAIAVSHAAAVVLPDVLQQVSQHIHRYLLECTACSC